MRYAVLMGDYVDNVIECEPEKIGAFVAVLGYTGYLAVPLDDPKARAIEPGGQIPNADAARAAAGDGVALDLNKIAPTVRASAVPAAERDAALRQVEAAREDFATRAAELVKSEAEGEAEVTRG